MSATGATRVIPAPSPVEEISELVAAAVLAVPGVADMHAGTYGEVASYLPGRSVTGVRLRADRAEVHVVLFWGAPVLATADAVRAEVMRLTGCHQVDVTVQDVIPAEPI